MRSRQPGLHLTRLSCISAFATFSALTLGGCVQSDSLRAGLEHHDMVVTPSYSEHRVALDSRPIEGKGAPFAQAPASQE